MEWNNHFGVIIIMTKSNMNFELFVHFVDTPVKMDQASNSPHTVLNCVSQYLNKINVSKVRGHSGYSRIKSRIAHHKNFLATLGNPNQFNLLSS